MQFSRLRKAIDIAQRVWPELVLDWMNTKSVQNVNISLVEKLQVNKLISWVIKWFKSWMPNWRTCWNFTHRAWAVWDLSNHTLFWIIPDSGSQREWYFCCNPSVESHFMPAPVRSRLRSGDSTVPTAECHILSGFIAPDRGQWIMWTGIQTRVVRMRWILFRILPIPIYRGQAC